MKDGILKKKQRQYTKLIKLYRETEHTTPIFLKVRRAASIQFLLATVPKLKETCEEFNNEMKELGDVQKNALYSISTGGFLMLGTKCAEEMRKTLAKVAVAMKAAAAREDRTTKAESIEIKQNAEDKIALLFEMAEMARAA